METAPWTEGHGRDERYGTLGVESNEGRDGWFVANVSARDTRPRKNGYDAGNITLSVKAEGDDVKFSYKVVGKSKQNTVSLMDTLVTYGRGAGGYGTVPV